MNFTREPLIETVITPKEGYKLVIRNSKGTGQEEFFVDAIEVICFGNATFYRSLEKPKCFLVPVTDYEILEVRESRMVLKSAGVERGIKIGGGRETLLKVSKEETPAEAEAAAMVEQRSDKRKDRRRSRKRRGKDDGEEESIEMPEVETPPAEAKERKAEKPSLIPPPATLISETLIARYKPQETSSDEHEPVPLAPKSDGDNGWREEEDVPF